MNTFDFFKKLSVGTTFKNRNKKLATDFATSSKKKPSNKESTKEEKSMPNQPVSKKKKIFHSGEDIPNPVETFVDLQKRFNLSQVILNNAEKMGFSTPTPIQMQAVPVLIERRELLACAPTGSGKTLAFLIPILHHLKEHKKCGFRALIVAPTRELSKQIHRECEKLSEGTGLRCHIIGKTSANKTISSKRYDILITTPNRLVFLLTQSPPLISLKMIQWLIIDESDKLFETGKQGFRDQLGIIYKSCDAVGVCRAMFSATYAHEVEQWCKLNMDNVVTVTVGARNSAVDIVNQKIEFVGNESGKLIAFRDLIKKGFTPPVLVFVQTKERAKELFTELVYDGINVDVIHADRTQTQRDNVVKSFRAGKIWVLICTELMSRGIDFRGVNLVVNYDFPPSSISYIHRVGRTGRAGRPGEAITFFTENDTVNLRSIAHIIKNSGCEVSDYLLAMKKTKRTSKKQLAKKAPSRESISTIPKPEQRRQKKKEIKLRIRKEKMNQRNKETVSVFN